MEVRVSNDARAAVARRASIFHPARTTAPAPGETRFRLPEGSLSARQHRRCRCPSPHGYALGQHLKPELGALVGRSPKPQYVLASVQIDANGHVDRAVFHPASCRIFTIKASRHQETESDTEVQVVASARPWPLPSPHR